MISTHEYKGWIASYRLTGGKWSVLIQNPSSRFSKTISVPTATNQELLSKIEEAIDGEIAYAAGRK
jgi:hypothetical protein